MTDSLALTETLQRICLEKGLTVGTAESCTGGLLAGQITAVSGSSAYFSGGIVSYDSSVKESVLGVSPQSIETNGVVSEIVALEMADGARHLLNVDMAVSITGVAGPGGGTQEKPVGLVWIGISIAEDHRAYRYLWDSDREGNRKLAVKEALRLMIQWAENTSKG